MTTTRPTRGSSVLDADPVQRGREKGATSRGPSRPELRRAIKELLASRKLSVGAEEEARISNCKDRATLESWLDAAADAPSAQEALR